MRLIESGRKKRATIGGGIFSLLLHIGLIALVVFGATRVAVGKTPQTEPERVVFISPQKPPEIPVVKKETPKPKEPVPEKKEPAPTVPDLPKEVPIIVPPVEIPNKLPEVDLSKPVTKEADFAERARTPAPTGDSTGTADTRNPSDPYFVSEVDAPPTPLSDNPKPRYPESLLSRRIEGEAIVEFVVDARGRADMATFRVISATDPLFGYAVRDVLPRMRFRPGSIGGKKVKTVVRMPFKFVLM
jgi:TonB family protein